MLTEGDPPPPNLPPQGGEGLLVIPSPLADEGLLVIPSPLADEGLLVIPSTRKEGRGRRLSPLPLGEG